MMTKNYQYIFITADDFPTPRPDVDILFGKYFRERNHKIDWVVRAADGEKSGGHINWRGFNVWVASTNNGSRRIDRVHKHILSLRNELRIFSLVKRESYDFILVKDKFIAAIMGLFATWKTSMKFVYWLSFPYPEASLLKAKLEDSKYPVFYRIRGVLFGILLYRVICRFADHIIVQSEEMKRQMTLHGVEPGKMSALPMGVDEEIIGFSTTIDASHQKNIVYLGALNRLRKLDFLLQAFAHIAHKHVDSMIYFVGDSDDPSDKAYLESEARRLNISGQVCFTGFLPKEEAMAYVANATLCVSPIPPGPVFNVSSPTKTLEYMALGRPVVANDIPDTLEVLEGSGGGICTPYEIKPFGDAIDWILRHPEEGQKMGDLGRKYIIKHRTYSALADQLELTYNTFLKDVRKGDASA